MGQPWGLSGPQFTGLYIAGFLVSLGIVYGVQAMLSRAGSRTAGTDVALDPYQAAYIAGGPTRVVDTGIASLALDQKILVARGGRLTATHGATTSEPVPLLVYRTVGDGRSRLSTVRRLRRHPEITAIGDGMRARGLLLSPPRVLLWRAVLLLPIAVWVVGLVRAVNGAHLHRPIGNLTSLVWLSGIVTVLVVLVRVRARHRPSPAGLAAVRGLRQRYRASGWTMHAGAQVAGVAVLGFTALHDMTLRNSLVASTGSGGGDGSGGGGGGCGGGGGGGGCGG